MVEGARRAVVAVHRRSCTVEFIGSDGCTIGLFEVPDGDLVLAEHAGCDASLGRDE